MAIKRRRTTTRAEPVRRRRTTKRKTTTRRPNGYQLFVRKHWQHGQAWGVNIRRIAGLWRQTHGTVTEHRRIIHHHHLRRSLSF